jgi:hypothetical protein
MRSGQGFSLFLEKSGSSKDWANRFREGSSRLVGSEFTFTQPINARGVNVAASLASFVAKLGATRS